MGDSTSDTASSMHFNPVIQKATDFHDLNKSYNFANTLVWYAVYTVAAIALQIATILLIKYWGSGYTFEPLNFAYYILLCATIFFIIRAKLLLLNRFWTQTHSKKRHYILNMLNYNSLLIAMFFSLYLTKFVAEFNILTKLIKNEIPKNVFEEIPKAKIPEVVVEATTRALRNIFTVDIPTLYLHCAIAVLVFLLKDIFVFTLNYNVQLNYYEERITKNMNELTILQQLTTSVNGSFTEASEITCERIMKYFGKDNSIEATNIAKVLGEENTGVLFASADNNRTGSIEFNELVDFFNHTRFEQSQLSTGLMQNDTSISSLNSVLTFICIPLAISSILSVSLKPDNVSNSKSYLAILAGALLSGGYIFADTFKHMISAITLVFFIRPFEVDDHIEVEDKIYRVHKMNIMTSVLVRNKLHVIYPNAKLFEKPITNYRLSKSCEILYKFDFNVEEFERCRFDFYDKLRNFTKDRPAVFRGRPYFKNIKPINGQTINLEIGVGFNLHNQETNNLHENKETFSLDILKLLKDSGITPINK
ncbi:hypothetical protein ENBRE01_0750 [Enteropsectra breve]|nr:hypothetical protein ENBRE01_0750 [Enteropsectra breve]